MLDKTNVMVEFIITGEQLDLNKLTNVIGISPSESWLKGDPIPDKKTARPDSCWILSTGYEESLDINDQLYKMMSRISSKIDILNDLKQEDSLKFVVAIVINVEEDIKPAMHFEKQFIEFAYNLKTEFYIELYNYS
ncbi:DUF4279 domain-containing protein [Paenibacillus shenyangensis]|uniref:DUF4279 domain-containing protein n=1 Tax=Paenibacillus sp. A9 TaxID=1284352 RepID=UPI00036FE3B3|nr:DUF4279 domain-containing protein [Paenibacillus sp. A9]